MNRMEDLADELAVEALDLEAELGDEGLIRRIADAIAGSSPTMEETFLTAVRIRRGERRAREALARARRAVASTGEAPRDAAGSELPD